MATTVPMLKLTILVTLRAVVCYSSDCLSSQVQISRGDACVQAPGTVKSGWRIKLPVGSRE